MAASTLLPPDRPERRNQSAQRGTARSGVAVGRRSPSRGGPHASPRSRARRPRRAPDRSPPAHDDVKAAAESVDSAVTRRGPPSSARTPCTGGQLGEDRRGVLALAQSIASSNELLRLRSAPRCRTVSEQGAGRATRASGSRARPRLRLDRPPPPPARPGCPARGCRRALGADDLKRGRCSTVVGGRSLKASLPGLSGGRRERPPADPGAGTTRRERRNTPPRTAPARSGT